MVSQVSGSTRELLTITEETSGSSLVKTDET